MRVNQKNNFIGEKPKMTYITEGKNLLTLYSINLKKKKKKNLNNNDQDLTQSLTLYKGIYTFLFSFRGQDPNCQERRDIHLIPIIHYTWLLLAYTTK